jgi:hypothetical protein
MPTTSWQQTVAAVSLCWTLLACSAPSDKPCKAGTKAECTCGTVGKGFKECKADESGYDSCACVVLDFTVLKDLGGEPTMDLALPDLQAADAAAPDDLTALDAAVAMPDTAMPDLIVFDMIMPDLIAADLIVRDMIVPDMSLPD